jgi:hypothetical protein
VSRRAQLTVAVVAVVLAVLAFVVFHGAGSPTPGGSASPQPSATTTASSPSPSASQSATTPPASALKPPMQGLVLERATMPPASDAGLIGGIVATVPWAQLQPTKGGPVPDQNPVDQAIAVARAFDAAHPATPIYVKIRVLAGTNAPDWAKTLGGFSPVSITNIQSGQAGTLGPFWTPGYAAAYADLQAKLAARYDSNPLVRDVTVAQCMTVFAEPFQRDDTNFAALYAAGYTVAADQECLRGQVDAHRVWKHTHQSLSFNPYKPWQLGATGALTQALAGEDFTLSVMAYCRAQLGAACTLENNSIRSAFIGMQSPTSSQGTAQLRQYAALYQEIVRLGPAITFQTAGPNAVGDLHATVGWAVSLGANSVEIPRGYAAALMRADNQALLANPTPA